MRTFILALGLTFTLTACAEEESQVVEDYDEATEGPIEEEVDGAFDNDTEYTGYGTYDLDNDGLLSNDEYDTGIGDGAFGTYDADADGYLNDDEYRVYEESLTM